MSHWRISLEREYSQFHYQTSSSQYHWTFSPTLTVITHDLSPRASQPIRLTMAMVASECPVNLSPGHSPQRTMMSSDADSDEKLCHDLDLSSLLILESTRQGYRWIVETGRKSSKSSCSSECLLVVVHCQPVRWSVPQIHKSHLVIVLRSQGK